MDPHRLRGAGSDTHITANTQLFIEHDDSQLVNRQSLGRACLNTGSALVADVHIDRVFLIVDLDT